MKNYQFNNKLIKLEARFVIEKIFYIQLRATYLFIILYFVISYTIVFISIILHIRHFVGVYDSSFQNSYFFFFYIFIVM